MGALSPPRTITKTEAAFAALREAIEQGRLAPGERLRVSRLMEELRMSPTPIREALRLLQAQGMAVYQAHQGMVVAEYSPESVEEVARIRSQLEPLALELAVSKASVAQVAEMRECHEVLRAAVARRATHPHAASLNAAWHAAVYRPADSRLLTDFIARLWAAVPVEAIWRSRRAARSVEQHELIMQAIERHDAAAARELMREHIEHGARSTLEQLQASASPRPRPPRRAP